jgi:[ribosomal protein S5]-alanine N-acetyltransferase
MSLKSRLRRPARALEGATVVVRLGETLQTERLVLRKPREADAQALFEAYTQDAEVTRYMIWRPHTLLAQTQDFIAGCLMDWDSGLRQPYVLAFWDSIESPIGMLEARLRPPLVDIGYVLSRAHWGRGLMPEAIRTLSADALSLAGVFRIQAICDAENRASARTLEKSGFVREGRLERYSVHPNIGHEPRPCLMYALCR